jgi:two-component system alkaline phosphatase synthesis response regulator PhoP
MRTIMIIDDDVELVENVITVLDDPDTTMVAMDTTEGAIQKLQEVQPDVLILDVMFPENPAGGFDLAREIRKTEEIKSLPIILLTGINQELPMDFSADDIDDDWMPVQEMLEKPFRITELETSVAKLITQTP